ncbi:MAG: DUF5666 domain-containing protein [Burkholderiaceae bacterium]
MKTDGLATAFARSRILIVAVGGALMVSMPGCGGGDGVLSPGSGGTGSSVSTTAVGPISGFGSIIVNGVHYDDSGASVVDDSGRTLSSNGLRLGMMVRIEGSSNSSTGIGAASAIQVFSELKGTVESVAADSIVVAGRTVRLLTSTVRDGFAVLSAGQFVEVYAFFDPGSGEFTATRVELKTPDEYKLRGLVTSWNATQQRFELGTIVVDYSGASLPGGFGVGRSVRVYATAAPVGGQWQASAVRISDDASRSSSGDRIEVEGLVSSFVSRAEFSVGDYVVDASSATFEDGALTDLVDGALVEIEGTLQNGRAIASRVEFKSGSSSSSSGSAGGGSADDSFEIKGRIDTFTSLAQFSVRNTLIDASAGSVVFERGSAAGLAAGVCVEIKGAPVTGPQGTVVHASEVKFDNDCQ